MLDDQEFLMGNTNTTTNTTSTGGGNAPYSTPSSSEQGSIVEHRPIIETRANDEMFLSPRVLDAGAFARYSEMLKSIILQASTQGRTLEDFSTDAEAMIKRCDQSSETINKRLQAGIRMLKMIDERAERTDHLLEKVQQSLPDSQALADQIEQLIETRLGESQIRFDVLAERAEERVLAAEARTREAIALSEKYASELAQLSARVDAQLGELDTKLEATQRESSRAIVEIVEQSAAASNGLSSAIDQVQSRAQEAGANLAFKINEAAQMADARLVELNHSIAPVLEASQLAMKTLGMDPENPVFEDSPLARIEQLVDRGETQLASLDRVYRQLEDLQSQAEGVRSVFGMWLVDAAKQLDVLEERKESLVGPMSDAADKIAALGPDLEEKLELASTQLSHLQLEQQTLRQTIQASSSIAGEVSEQMTNQSGQLQALLDGSLHKLSTRVEQAGVWLGALIQRAESLGATLPDAGTMNFGSPVSGTDQAVEAARVDEVEIEALNRAETIATEVAVQEVAIEEPLIEDVVEEVVAETSSEHPPRVYSPQPPCLPIDALSFDGASFVIKHEPGNGTKDQ